ncbi:AAA family ATPase [Paenibacillus sp. WC2504]|uniref:AAA family ATPase n=1 Tax=Paenibacillus sp. WC2504 TaxID=3461403 RepID=UPI004045CD03
MSKPLAKVTDDLILFDLNRPDIPSGSHPIDTDDYQIPTNEIVKLFASVCRWVQLRTTGATIFGRPRLGKTWMIKYLVKNIPQYFKENIPIFHIVSLHSKIAKEEEFIETLLSDMDHDLALVGKLNAKRQRLIHFLTELGKQNSRRLVILFIDEAQCLDEQHYEWLIDYFNKLEKVQTTLTIFLVGQDQLNSQKTIFSRGNTDQIIQRFMIDEHKFSGIKSVEDIETCLKCYDTESEYPLGSGWSFTRFYFPEAFATGERLEKFAKDIYEIFSSLRQKNNIKGTFEIPMQHMVKAIKIIFIDYGKNSSKSQHWISKSNWMEAILKSNYVSSEIRKKINKDK